MQESRKIMRKLDFIGKKVLITGASIGIGKALAYAFARRGAHLALGALPQEESLLNEVAKDIRQTFHVDTWCFPADLTDPEGPAALYRAVQDQTGGIDVLVNNAGTLIYGKFWEQPPDGLKRIVDVNLNAPAQLMRLFLPDMIARKTGAVLNVSSVSAFQPAPYQTLYGASKAGLQSLSQGVRAELKGTGVTVCTLNPPYVDTAMLRQEGFPKRLRWFSISGLQKPEWLAEKALRALEKQKFLYVPGFRAWLIHIVLVRISPKRMVDWMSRFFLQGKA